MGKHMEIPNKPGAQMAAARTIDRPAACYPLGNNGFEEVLEQQKIIMLRWLPDGTIISANKVFYQVVQCAPDEIAGAYLTDSMRPEDSTRLHELINCMTPDNPFYTWEHPLILANGSTSWQRWTEQGFFDENGKLIEIRSVAHDITAKKRAESSLGVSELLNIALLQALPDLMFIINREGVYIDYHVANPEDLVVRPEELVGKNVYELLPAATASVISKAYETVFRTGEMQIVDYPLKITSELKFFKAYIVPFGEDKLLSIIRNVTEVRRTVEKLRQTEQRYHSIFEGVRDGILVENNDGRIIDVNQAACQMYGFTRKQFMEKTVYDISDPKHVIVVDNDLSKLIQRIPETPLEVVNIRSNGERFPAEITARIRSIGDNLAAIVVVRDISERKKEQEELLRLSAAMQITSDAIVITNHEGKIIEVNKALLKLIKAGSHDEIIGKSIFRLVPLKDRKKTLLQISQITNPQAVSYSEINIKTSDRQIIPVEISVTVMEDADKQLNGYVLMVRDITKRKENELKLRQLCSYDVLTGINNRFSFEEEIARLNDSTDFPISLIMLDTDGLKHINDTLGHSKGDEFLSKVAKVLQKSFRETDFIARIGGDEFVVIMVRTDQEAMHQAIERLKHNIELADRQTPEYCISVSIGGYCACHNTSLHEALYRADEIMYREKENKRSR